MPRFGNFSVTRLTYSDDYGATRESHSPFRLYRVTTDMYICVLSAGMYNNPHALINALKTNRLHLIRADGKGNPDPEVIKALEFKWVENTLSPEEVRWQRIEIIVLYVDPEHPDRFVEAKNFHQTAPFSLTEDQGGDNDRGLTGAPDCYVHRMFGLDPVTARLKFHSCYTGFRLPIGVFDHTKMEWIEVNGYDAWKQLHTEGCRK